MLKYALSHTQPELTELSLFDVLGIRVRTLVQATQPAGYSQVEWDGRDAAGNMVASGSYYYQLNSGSFTQIKKMILLR